MTLREVTKIVYVDDATGREYDSKLVYLEEKLEVYIYDLFKICGGNYINPKWIIYYAPELTELLNVYLDQLRTLEQNEKQNSTG